MEIISKIREQLKTPEAFVRWLTENRTEVVGESNNSADCPVRNFLQQRISSYEKWSNREHYLYVSKTTLMLQQRGTFGVTTKDTLPFWVQTFIEDVDFLGRNDDIRTDSKRVPLLGSDCLRILSKSISSTSYVVENDDAISDSVVPAEQVDQWLEIQKAVEASNGVYV